MKERIHKCKHCGHQSSDEEEIRACEEQGTEHEYPVGTEIEFKVTGRRGKWFPATISRVEYAQGDHAPIYILLLTEETAGQLEIESLVVKYFSEDSIRLPQAASALT